MPSLKMKTKSCAGCLKEKNGLHVSKKSSVICKSPLSQARLTQNEDVAALLEISQDVSLCNKEYFQGTSDNEANCCEFPKGADHVQEQHSTVTGSATIGATESTQSACTSSLGTIFSPILESLDACNDEGSDHLYMPQLDTEESDDSSRSSSEYQSCNISDFYISDVIFSGPPIESESNSMFHDDGSIAVLPDHNCEESALFFDLSEECIALPFLEDSLDSGNDPDGRRTGETTLDMNDSSLYLAIHQLKSCNQESEFNIYGDSDQADCFDPQMYIRNLPDQLDVASNLLPTVSPKKNQKSKQVTLVLDLDETLVHSTLEQCDDADFTFPVFFNMKEHTVYVRQRPHLHAFLERVSEMFEIVVFTASQSIYAKQLLDILDPDGKFISRRAYRESCIFSEGSYMKDLTVLGVDLAKVVIIDNSPQVFRLQVNNGIPIQSWFDDPSDCALISLLPFLETLVDADDVRPIIARRFGNKE